MSEESTGTSGDDIALTVDVVAAYVSNNHVAGADLPALIGDVHAALVGTRTGTGAVAEAPVEKPAPGQVRRSVTDDGLTSFIDGRTYKTLKRHLTVHGLTPDTYRARYGLPDDYPMVCASYSAQRSNLAKAIGLGVPGGRSEAAGGSTKGRRQAA